MSDRTATQMDSTAIASFLETHHTGVLSLASGDDAYAVPVSYAVGESVGELYFRLGFGPGSQKRSYLEATDTATFVVYDQVEGNWESVVAHGRLETLAAGDADAAVATAVEGLEIPYFQVFDRPVADLDFELVRLNADSVRGVRSGDLSPSPV